LTGSWFAKLHPTMNHQKTLISIFNAGICAVSGRESVIRALKNKANFKPDLIIAVGKAAGDMCLGAQAIYGQDTPAIVATKYQHADPDLLENPCVTLIESGHPIPDENSLRAGGLLIDTIRTRPANSQLLLLVSGGASAIAEYLPADMTLADWQELNRRMVSSGLNIAEINSRRKSVSLIKDGRLLEAFSGQKAIICAISDVEGDSISTIGSGIGDINRSRAAHEVIIVACNQMARDASAAQAHKLGFEVKQNTETLYDDVYKLSSKLGGFLRHAEKGIYIWGGEPTIGLPENPGNGGRNQSLGLAMAKEIVNIDNIHILVAGTDGTDGPTDAAGAIVDGTTFREAEAAQTALDSANAGDYLEKVGGRFVTGPTGTNVMDLVIAIVA
jgi:glycerate 2-kinase